MGSKQNDQRAGRRQFVLSAASAGMLGLGAASSAQAVSRDANAARWPSGMAGLARLRDYQVRRASSYDRTGGNADFIRIAPGATATLLDARGAGIVTHIWITINSPEPYHLKKLVLRAFWDGEAEPSVEVPVGDFFGLSLGDYFLYQSALTAVAPMKALNAYFPMPFGRSARITVSNEGTLPVSSFYFNLDYTQLAAPLRGAA